MKKYVLLALCCFGLQIASTAQQKRKSVKAVQKDLTTYVNPFIGTGLHGHVFLGANVPFGAVQLGPVNKSKGWDWCSGYNYSDSTIVGFAHTHLSGTGIGDLGDIQFMPVTGDLKGTKIDTASYYSLFSHRDEVSKPGYYAVKLKRYNIDVALTSTSRVGFHQYTFPKSTAANVIINLQDGIGWDRSVDTYLKQVNDTTLVGYRHSSGWAKDQRIYFTAIFSKPIRSFSVYDSVTHIKGTAAKGKKINGIVNFSTKAGEQIKIKVGISPVSIENALLNIKAEANTWDFENIRKRAKSAWNKELEKVTVKADYAVMQTFYTALYHTMIAPSVNNDHNKDYLGTDKKVYKKAPFNNVTTLSLWDTYRAQNPLMTIFQPDHVNDLINNMLKIYEQQGKLPVWHLMGNETDCMVGNSAIPIIVDAYLKGFKGFDAQLAYEAVKQTAMQDVRGLKYVKSLGYIPADTVVESVASGLEYAINDWCIAQMALKLGYQRDYIYFSKRGKNYINYFSREVGFMRGRISENKWRTPFDPFSAIHMKDDFTEGNAWQYTWLVPHDVEGLIGLLGGEKAFAAKLDSLFTVNSKTRIQSNDITGLIGQYAHGNEPSHHIAYLYAYVGEPYKTAEKVRYIQKYFYTNENDGIIGNEDVGQMSAWYVLSALGFYPVNPANGTYVFGSPLINEAQLKLANGKVFWIKVANNTAQNIYVQSMVLNGKPYHKSFLLHQDLMKGGQLTIMMGNKPSKQWGIAPAMRPRSVM